MTKEQVDDWRKAREIARKIEDDEERTKALVEVYDLRDDMMMHCIQRQADRIKTSLANSEQSKKDISRIETELKPLKETDKAFREGRLKLQGAKMMLNILRYVAAAGGGAAVIKLLGV